VWLKLAITNQLNPVTGAVIGSATNLVAPPNTAMVRQRVVFRQPANAAGAVLFDDLRLTTVTSSEFPVPMSVARTGTNLNLGFPTYLGLPYELRWKANLSDPDWQPLTNIIGSGSIQSVALDFQPLSRFFKIARPCN
jgi:hypothetical protein